MKSECDSANLNAIVYFLELVAPRYNISTIIIDTIFLVLCSAILCLQIVGVPTYR